MFKAGRIALVLAPLAIAGCGGNGSDTASQRTDADAPVNTASPAPEATQPSVDAQQTDAAPDAAGTVASEPPQPTQADAPPAAAVQPPVAFAQCRSCHSTEAGKNGIGPSLHGVVGHKAASVAGFNYSPALKGSGIVWDRASLDEWLSGPIKMVPGTRMVIALPNAEARKSVIDYLETLK